MLRGKQRRVDWLWTMIEDSENMSHPTSHDDRSASDLTADRIATRRVGVLVLGMHRSGTSAITRMLSLLGCSLPKTLIAANPTNPEGHWESAPISQLNNEIFAQAGTHWDDWLAVNPRLAETLIWPQLIAQGREMLRQEFADAPLFVLKDPRICKLGGFWLEVLAAEGIAAAFVLPLRNPIEVARSLMTRDGAQEYQALLTWLRYVLAAEAATRGHPRMFTEFAALLADWEILAARLSDELGVVWPRISKFSGLEISQFLAPDLRHHLSQTTELENNPAVSPWVAQTYRVLLGWAQHGEQAADYPILDRISREFDDAGATFARPLLKAELAGHGVAQAQAERAAIAAERDTLARRLGELDQQFGEACAERDARTAERDARTAERDARTAERDQLASEIAALGALGEERDKIAWRLGEVEAELARTVAQRDAQTAERDRLAGERAVLAEELDRITSRLGEVEADVARATANHEAAQARVFALEDDLATAHAGADALNHRLAVTQSTLRQREEEIGQLGRELDTTRLTMAGQADVERAARNDAERLSRECHGLRQEIAAASADRAAESTRMQRELAEAQAARRTAEEQSAYAMAQKDAQDRNVEDRFAELAELTRLLYARDSEVKAAQAELARAKVLADNRLGEVATLTRRGREHEQLSERQTAQVEWLRRVHAVVSATPRWWAIMPKQWRRQQESQRLLRKGLFDADAYLARYPDVQREGMAPLRHYILHGMVEGRSI